MKPLFIFLAISLALNGYSQKKSTNTEKDEKDCNVRHPLPDSVFDRMIIQDITYAIVGENLPVSGLKIDVTKPEGTISGLFKLKGEWLDLISFDIKGGITDRNFSIFKGFSKFNTSFEARPSFHFIPAASGAMYGVCDSAVINTRLVNAINNQVLVYASNVTDSFYVVTKLRNRHLGAVSNEYPSPIISFIDTAKYKLLIVHFIKKIKKDDNFIVDTSGTLLDVIDRLEEAKLNGIDIAPNSYYDEAQVLYKKYKKLHDGLEEVVINKMITNASEIWTRKKYFWTTFTPFARTEKITEYHTKYEGKDSSYFKTKHPFYYGASIYLNWYVFYPKRKFAYLVRPGVSITRGSNLTTLTPFSYETRLPFFSYPTAITEKTKSGSAYNASDVQNGFVGQVHVESYLLPMMDQFLPGFYISTSFNYSKLYELSSIKDREKDHTQIMMEGGLVININSREKDKEKTILSILAYMRHQDLSDKRRTTILTGMEESRDDYRQRNVSLGIRVGIPINLTQRQK